MDTSICGKWIKTIGKRKIQSFQDSFADSFNISLGIINLQGKALTVWSNSSLFCHLIIQNNRERCKSEQQCMIDYVLKKRETIQRTCYMGITYFACPIFFNKDIAAICLGGGIYLERDKELIEHTIIQDVPVLSELKLNDCVRLLENVSNLLNVDEVLSPVSESKIDEVKQELFFLKKKLSLREIEIVNLINFGLTNKEISIKLNISEKTVKTHITNILRKLNMKDRLQIILFCKDNFMK